MGITLDMDRRPKSNYWFWKGLYKCKLCPYSSKVVRDLVIHVKSHNVKSEKTQDEISVRIDLKKNVRSPSIEIPLTNISFGDGTNNKTLTNISYINGLFMCKLCPYTTRDARTLRGHIKLHEKVAHNPVGRDVPDKNEGLTCDQCTRILADKWSLERHKRSVHLDIRSFKCDSCNYASSRMDHLIKHKISIHKVTANSSVVSTNQVAKDPLAVNGTNDHEMIKADKHFSQKSCISKEDDASRSHGKEIFQKEKTTRSFDQKSSLSHYKIKECKVLLNRIKIEDLLIKSGEKKVEEKTKDSHDASKEESLCKMKPLESKVSNILHSRGISCSQCGSVFTAVEYLRTHLKIHHPATYLMFQVMNNENLDKIKSNKIENPDSEQERTEDNTSDLPREGDDLTTNDELEDLTGVHEGRSESEGKGKQEAEMFYEPEEMTNIHKMKGGKAKSVKKGGMVVDHKGSQCPECELTFSTGDNLETHLRNIHPTYFEESKGAEYKTEDTKDYNLNEIINLNVNIWKCDFCDYSSIQRGKLRRHIKVIHNEIKDFKCDTCGYVSSDKRRMEIHKRVVHNNIKDQFCDVCKKAFGHAQTLRRHKRQVHGKVKDYVCDLCDYGVSTKLMLQLHKMKAHQ